MNSLADAQAALNLVRALDRPLKLSFKTLKPEGSVPSGDLPRDREAYGSKKRQRTDASDVGTSKKAADAGRR